MRTRVPWLDFEEKRKAYEEVKKVGQQLLLPRPLPLVVLAVFCCAGRLL
jgi:hypothetical protein